MGTGNKHIPKGVPKKELHATLSYLVARKKPVTKLTVVNYYKNFQLMSRLRGTALCLLKTQYAKKPKNPV